MKAINTVLKEMLRLRDDMKAIYGQADLRGKNPDEKELTENKKTDQGGPLLSATDLLQMLK